MDGKGGKEGEGREYQLAVHDAQLALHEDGLAARVGRRFCLRPGRAVMVVGAADRRADAAEEGLHRGRDVKAGG